MKLWHILAGVGAGLLLFGKGLAPKMRPRTGGGIGGGESTAPITDPENANKGQGVEPTDYPEPPIPGDVKPNWRKPDTGWSKLPPLIWMPPAGYIPAPNSRQDSKQYWWLVVVS